jgi:anti-anti-sigma factor
MPEEPYVMQRRVRDVLILEFTPQELHGETLCSAATTEALAAVAGLPGARVVVDLQRVVYLASMGLAILLHLRRKVLEQDGRLVLCGVGPQVLDLLEVTRLAGDDRACRYLFEVAADETAALALLEAPVAP